MFPRGDSIMGKIPEEILKHRPAPSTEVKLINGHYYVYAYHAVKLASGNWGKKTDKCIGSITAEKGFKPNRNYEAFRLEHNNPGEDSSDSERIRLQKDKDAISVLEYGQYALIEQVAASVKKMLLKHFPEARANQIFAYASLLYINRFMYMDQVKPYFDQSWLFKIYPDIDMGRKAIGTLLDDLGRRTIRVREYEQDLIDSCSSEIAIDGHAIRSNSDYNDLGEPGYKFGKLNSPQVNYLMAYDVNTEMPLFSKIYRGSYTDKVSVKDFAGQYELHNILFIVDRGFYSKENLKLFSENGNHFIIPVPSNTIAHKTVMKSNDFEGSFYYGSGENVSEIQFRSMKISDTETIYAFRDLVENMKSRYNYERNISLGKRGFTEEGLKKYKDTLGMYVLLSNSDMSPEEVFKHYKRRWKIETFFQFLKNRGDFNYLKFQDYYLEQGFAFIMLITGQIHQLMVKAVKSQNDRTFSTRDAILTARMMKMERQKSTWYLKNIRKKDLERLAKMGFTPQLYAPV